MSEKTKGIMNLNERSREIFRVLVEEYLETGSPVGSQLLSSRYRKESLSSATIRNVLADLEFMGFLRAPHTSAGRIPTDSGLQMFVEGLLKVDAMDEGERRSFESECLNAGSNVETFLAKTSERLAELSGCASLVISPKKGEASLKHIEFVQLGNRRALVVLITEDGVLENRLIDLPEGLPFSSLTEAGNYLNARLRGKTIRETRSDVVSELKSGRSELDALTRKLIEKEIAAWSGDENRSLIITGQSNLLDDIEALEELEKVRSLLEMLEAKENISNLLELSEKAENVRIFIGSDNRFFKVSGCSMISAPYRNSFGKIIGAIGVVGPSRMNYAKIIPLVDYTSHIMTKRLGS